MSLENDDKTYNVEETLIVCEKENIPMVFNFLKAIKGSIPQIDCMIEAKRKDEALFRLMEEIRTRG